MHLVYDVAHNIAKVERYAEGDLWFIAKGRRAPLGRAGRNCQNCIDRTGQPVICGGSMETGSYLLAGTKHAMHETFGSTMHGSGRTMSRAQAKKTVSGEQIRKQMEQRGIIVKAVSMSGLIAEEAGWRTRIFPMWSRLWSWPASRRR